MKYLKEYLTTLPESNRAKISALLTDSVDSGAIVSVAEYAAWYKHIVDTLDKFFEPTTKAIPAEQKALIYSSVLNYLANSISHDLEALFTEANALFDFTNLNKVANDNLLGQLRSQIFHLLSSYENLKALRQHGSDWSKGVYTLFKAGGALFLPRGYLLKDNIYTDYDGNTLKPMEIVDDADMDATTGKLVLGGEFRELGLTEPEILWDPLVADPDELEQASSTEPDFQLQTGTDIRNSIDGDELTHWVEILCFDNPVVPNETPTVQRIKSANKTNSFDGTVTIHGHNESHKPREFYVKFITKGVLGTAKYVCSDDGVVYTDLICTHDKGRSCEYDYTDFYNQSCRNTVCTRYRQIGAVTTSTTESTPIFNSHNEDTGLAIEFTGDSEGYFYPGDTWKVTCTCQETYGARLRYSVRTKCNSKANWLVLKPILDRPFWIDSIQYYDETRHYYEEEGLPPKYLVNQPIYVDAPIRLDFEPRIITRLIINMRQENYSTDNYNILASQVSKNTLIKDIVESNADDIDGTTINDIVYRQFGNTDLRDMLMSAPTDKVLMRDTYSYVLGFADLSLGYSSYNTAGRSILKSLRTSKLGVARLNVIESTDSYLVSPITVVQPGMLFGQVDPVLVSTEYDLFIKNYNAQEGWVSSIDIPMLPHVRQLAAQSTETTEAKNEHLRVEDGVGKLRFYSTEVEQVYSVYNGEILTPDTDYTIRQQTDIVPYGTYIDLSDYLAKQERSTNSLFVVTYKPKTGVYLDKRRHAYLDASYNVKLNLSALYPKVMYSDIYVMITGRRNTYTHGMTPMIHKVHLLVGEVDEYKFYPEGDIDEESGTILLTDSTSVK